MTAYAASLVENAPISDGGGYVAAVLADTPAVYWRLSDAAWSSGAVVADSSGNGNAGSYLSGWTGQGQALITEPGGVALYGAGTVTRADGTVVNDPNVVTLEFWINIGDTAPGFNSMFRHMNFGVAGWTIQKNGVGSTTVALRIDTSAAINQVTVCSVPVIDGLTHHVVCVINNGTVNWYVDGVAAGSGTYQVGTGFSNTGSLDAGTVRGAYDEIAVYNGIALSAAKVKAHYLAGLAGIKRTLKPPRLMDDASTARDSKNLVWNPSAVQGNTNYVGISASPGDQVLTALSGLLATGAPVDTGFNMLYPTGSAWGCLNNFTMDPLGEGETCTISFWWRRLQGTATQGRTQLCSSNNAYMVANNPIVPLTAAWAKVTQTLTLTKAMRNVDPNGRTLFQLNVGSVGTVLEIQVCNVQIERGGVATAVELVPVAPRALVAPRNVSESIAGLVETLVRAPVLSRLLSEPAPSIDSLIRSLVLARKLYQSAHAFDEANLLAGRNPSFKQGAVGWGDFSGSYGGQTFVYGATDNPRPGGSNTSAKMTLSGTATGSPGVIGPNVSVIEGENLTASAWVAVDRALTAAMSPWIVIRCFRADGTIVNDLNVGAPASPGGNAYQRLSVSSVLPAGTVNVQPMVRIGVATVAVIWMTDFQVEIGLAPTSFGSSLWNFVSRLTRAVVEAAPAVSTLVRSLRAVRSLSESAPASDVTKFRIYRLLTESIAGMTDTLTRFFVRPVPNWVGEISSRLSSFGKLVSLLGSRGKHEAKVDSNGKTSADIRSER